MGCSDLLAGPHEQGIGGIGTMGLGPMPPMVPMVYRNAKVGHEFSTFTPWRSSLLRSPFCSWRAPSVAVTTPWGTLMIPVSLNWIACAVAILLTWFGYTASRSDQA